MAALAPLTTTYAAPVPEGGTPLTVDARGLPVAPPWTLSAVGEDAPLPPGLSIGGRAVADIAVYPEGALVPDDVGFDAGGPRPLAELRMASVIAPLWAMVEPGGCPGEPAGDVERASGPGSVSIIWRDVPVAGCLGQRATFSATLTWDEAAVVRRLEFRYEALPLETLAVEPRAGFQLQGAGGAFELFPDPEVGQLRGRAKLLFDGMSDREQGAWVIELADDGQVVGEREPENVDENRQPGRPDGWREADNCPDHFNPLQENLDGDDDGDVCDDDADDDGWEDEDNCPLVANPGQADHDGDGDGDACDPDDDDDGWPDLFDRCPYRFDPSNQDLDRDGLGDACDPDPDGDDRGLGPQGGWRGDTCPFVADPGHPDRDKDGLGDACDLLPAHPCRFMCAWQRDADGDGVGDLFDVCRTVRDPAQLDRDGDGLGDACDPDADGDGRNDALDLFERLDGLGAPSGVIDVRRPRLP